MKTIKYTLVLSLLFGTTPSIFADDQFTPDELKKVEYLENHPDKLEKLEDLPEWKRQKAFEKFDLTQEEYDAAITKKSETKK